MSLTIQPFVADRSHPTFRDGQLLMKENFVDPSATTEDYLDWLYLRNPFGNAKGFIVYEDGRPVSQLFLIFQQCLHQGRLHRVAVASNACTSPSHRKQGLFHRLVVLLVDEARAAGVPFIWAYPNPSSLRGFLKAGFEVVKQSFLEVSPVNCFGILADLFSRERFTVLAGTEDVPLVRGEWQKFRLLSAADGLTDAAPDRSRVDPLLWHVPLTREQLAWRYFQAPGRQYYVLEHKTSGRILILRCIRLFGMKTALIMKSDASGPGEYNALLRDVGRDLKGVVNFCTSMPSETTGPGVRALFRGRFPVPRQVSPRQFPLVIYPVAGRSVLQSRFDFVLGDYEAL